MFHGTTPSGLLTLDLDGIPTREIRTVEYLKGLPGPPIQDLKHRSVLGQSPPSPADGFEAMTQTVVNLVEIRLEIQRAPVTPKSRSEVIFHLSPMLSLIHI